jgi:TolB-like protein/DNA-binding winged helix-turn-helix (wHTH) protein/Tfp pilus assembly protein PilF
MGTSMDVNAAAAQAPASRIRFGPFELDRAGCALTREGERVRIQDQPLRILELLINRAPGLVTRDDLRKHLWPDDTFVDFEHGMNTAVRKLRHALGDSADHPRYVETVEKRGYRFVAPIEPAPADMPVAAPRGVAGLRRVPRLGLALVACSLIALLAAIVFWPRERRATSGAGAIRSLAILPLANLSGDPSQEYLSDGLTEELITALGRLSELRVISRTSAMGYKGVSRPIPAIARELGVDAVVEGSVWRADGRVRVSAKLVHGITDAQLWARSFDEDERDLLQLRTDIAAAIANEIRLQLTPHEQARLAAARRVYPEVYQLYLTARYHAGLGTPQGQKTAAELYRRALEIDPDSALALTGLAEYYVFAAGPGSPAVLMREASSYARRAVEIDAASAEAHAALGLVLTHHDRRWDEAEREFRQAIALNPGLASAHERLAHLLAALGRFEDAVRHAERAVALDPRAPFPATNLGRILYFARRYDDAISQYRRTLEMHPRFTWALFLLAVAHEQKREFAQAMAALEETVRYNVGNSAAAILRRRYEAGGYSAVLAGWIDLETQAVGEGPMRSSSLVMLNSRLGRTDEAFRWLERSYESGSRDLIYLAVEPQYDPIRRDPRFSDFLTRVGLTGVRYASH